MMGKTPASDALFANAARLHVLIDLHVAALPAQGTPGPTFGFSLFIGGHAFTPIASSLSNIAFIDNAPPKAPQSPFFTPPQGDTVYAGTQGLSIPEFSNPYFHAPDFLTSVFFSARDPSGKLFSLDHLSDGLSYHSGQSITVQLSTMDYLASVGDVWPPLPPLGYSIIGTIDNIYTPADSTALFAVVPEPPSSVVLATGAVALFAWAACTVCRRERHLRQ